LPCVFGIIRDAHFAPAHLKRFSFFHMTPQTTLELKGNSRAHPFAELIVEIVHAKLSGSLRLSSGSSKTILYFDAGRVVYAVSNARKLRLFSILLAQNKIDQAGLGKHLNFTSDLELAASLEESRDVSRKEIDAMMISQSEAVIIDALSWPEGEWHFSPLARLRDDLKFDIDVFRILIECARCVPSHVASQRFKSVVEAFYLSANGDPLAYLQAHEISVLSHFDGSPMTIDKLKKVCVIPEAGMMQALYVLWLGGILVRRDWNVTFSAAKIAEILGAKVSRVKAPVNLRAPKQEPEPIATVEEVEAEPIKLPELHLSLEEYLERVEKAETHYDIFGVGSDGSMAAIKAAYFAMAKLFHPDRYHREPAKKLRRIQLAFTELAHAYETLKNPESRESYDFKIRKELEAREKRRAAGRSEAQSGTDRQAEQGLESFEQGLSMLAEEEYEAAAVYLGRAVHYNPQNALYHAYYGQALSADENQLHKAESEIQMAVKLEPDNAKIRMMLVEFFIEMNMLKRAEGELKRFLEIAPDNKEAAKLLAGLQN
jgi:Flp pilus assembly protein TadD